MYCTHMCTHEEPMQAPTKLRLICLPSHLYIYIYREREMYEYVYIYIYTHISFDASRIVLLSSDPLCTLCSDLFSTTGCTLCSNTEDRDAHQMQNRSLSKTECTLCSDPFINNGCTLDPLCMFTCVMHIMLQNNGEPHCVQIRLARPDYHCYIYIYIYIIVIIIIISSSSSICAIIIHMYIYIYMYIWQANIVGVATEMRRVLFGRR